MFLDTLFVLAIFASVSIRIEVWEVYPESSFEQSMKAIGYTLSIITKIMNIPSTGS